MALFRSESVLINSQTERVIYVDNERFRKVGWAKPSGENFNGIRYGFLDGAAISQEEAAKWHSLLRFPLHKNRDFAYQDIGIGMHDTYYGFDLRNTHDALLTACGSKTAYIWRKD